MVEGVECYIGEERCWMEREERSKLLTDTLNDLLTDRSVERTLLTYHLLSSPLHQISPSYLLFLSFYPFHPSISSSSRKKARDNQAEEEHHMPVSTGYHFVRNIAFTLFSRAFVKLSCGSGNQNKKASY